MMPVIYILDYDADIMDILCNWFESNGYKVKCFSSHEQLYQQLIIGHPDCIILDCLYGKFCMSSQLCHTIRQIHHYNGQVIVTSTSSVSEKDLKICNAIYYIDKPFDLYEILQLVSSSLVND